MNCVVSPAPWRHFHRMLWLTALFTASTIVFGAFVRLSDAGLGCPDWPTCYGRVTWPQTGEEAAAHPASRIRPLETGKAWREQIHRFLAGALGVEVLVLSLVAAWRRRLGIVQILLAVLMVASSMALFLSGWSGLAMAVAVAGEAMLLWAALRWSNVDLARAAVLTLAVVIFQALLGMWTVTLLLKPIVVMGHLLGGMLMFSLLVWMAWRATGLPIILDDGLRVRRLLRLGVGLLGVQIALGGWVSANYAALACGGGDWSSHNFPQCVSQWWPPHDFRAGFTLWRGIGVDYEGGVLDGASRIAIQMAHRLWAVVAGGYLWWLAWRLSRLRAMRGWALALALLLAVQMALGILNVKLALPLAISVLHNAGAVVLLFVLVSLLARLRAPE